MNCLGFKAPGTRRLELNRILVLPGQDTTENASGRRPSHCFKAAPGVPVTDTAHPIPQEVLAGGTSLARPDAWLMLWKPAQAVFSGLMKQAASARRTVFAREAGGWLLHARWYLYSSTHHVLAYNMTTRLLCILTTMNVVVLHFVGGPILGGQECKPLKPYTLNPKSWTLNPKSLNPLRTIPDTRGIFQKNWR